MKRIIGFLKNFMGGMTPYLDISQEMQAVRIATLSVILDKLVATQRNRSEDTLKSFHKNIALLKNACPSLQKKRKEKGAIISPIIFFALGLAHFWNMLTNRGRASKLCDKFKI